MGSSPGPRRDVAVTVTAGGLPVRRSTGWSFPRTPGATGAGRPPRAEANDLRGGADGGPRQEEVTPGPASTGLVLPANPGRNRAGPAPTSGGERSPRGRRRRAPTRVGYARAGVQRRFGHR